MKKNTKTSILRKLSEAEMTSITGASCQEAQAAASALDAMGHVFGNMGCSDAAETLREGSFALTYKNC
jgi:hypothetical protein